MAKLINPRASVRVYSDNPFVIEDLFIEYSITKDLSEEPNEAELLIYNLSPSTRDNLTRSNIQSTPIEIYLTPTGLDSLVMAFRGEIDTVKHSRQRPDYVTEITATAQKDNHRAFSFGPKTYAQGTPQSQILTDLVSAVGLTSAIDSVLLLPNPILLAQSFSGPAFALLQRFCTDNGMNAYINDGKVFVTSIYKPPVQTPKTIKRSWMLSTPSFTTRQDSQDIEMRTIVETTTINPFAKLRKKTTKRSKWAKYEKQNTQGDKDYVEYQAVDKTINGVDFELLLQPDMQPDDLIVVLDYAAYSETYRVQEVHHSGDNFGGDWVTSISTDVVEAGIL